MVWPITITYRARTWSPFYDYNTWQILIPGLRPQNTFPDLTSESGISMFIVYSQMRKSNTVLSLSFTVIRFMSIWKLNLCSKHWNLSPSHHQQEPLQYAGLGKACTCSAGAPCTRTCSCPRQKLQSGNWRSTDIFKFYLILQSERRQ